MRVAAVMRLAVLLLPTVRSLALPPLTSLADGEAMRAQHYFSTTASWLIPGHVLCGRYPGSCPSRPVDRETQRARLAAIREHATTFVCLQSELPPQDAPELWPDGGIGGQSGNAVAPQTAKFQPYFDDARDAEHVHFGIVDRDVAPSLAALCDAVDGLQRRVLRGEVLYIHCWGGQGRTGILAACLLGALYEELVDAEEALERVQQIFRLREPDKGGASPETDPQRDQVRDWFYEKTGGGFQMGPRVR